MVGTSKILTVSYGTFSCTLEGFDDSFSTMKAIAEYFRDLAADDRYFGAEPPTPDADMLARIAEREIARRVEARQDGNEFVLKASQALVAPSSDQDADVAELTGDDNLADHAANDEADVALAPTEEDTADDVSEDDAAPTRDEAFLGTDDDAFRDETFAGLADDAADDAAEDDLVADDPDDHAWSDDADDAWNAAPDLTLDNSDADGTSDERDVVAEENASEYEEDDEALDEASSIPDVAAEPGPDALAAPRRVVPQRVVAEREPDVEQVAQAPDTPDEAEPPVLPPAAETPPAHPDADSVAAKLQRIRAVVGQAASADDEVENEHSVTDAAPESLIRDMVDESAPAEADDAADVEIAEAPAEVPPAPSPAPVRARVVKMRMADYRQALESADDAASAEVAKAHADPADVDDLDEAFDDTDDIADLEALDGVAETIRDDAEDQPLSAGNQDDASDYGLSAEEEAELMAELAELEHADYDDLEGDTGPTADADEFDQEPAPIASDEDADDDAIDAIAAALAMEEADDASAYDAPEASVTAADEDGDDETSLNLFGGEFDEDFDAPDDMPEALAEQMDLEDEADDDDAELESVATAEPAERPRHPAFATDPDADDEAMSRILARTDDQLSHPDTNRRRESLSQVKAAVAAKEAALQLGENGADEDENADDFRKDLRQAVRPRRPIREGDRTDARPERPRAAPLKLVAAQRVDVEDDAKESLVHRPAMPVRPRRIRAEGEAEQPTRDSSFETFARDMGAHSLGDLLEAAAAYTSYVEGSEDFSRPQLMNKIRGVSEEEFSREEGLRSFGTLLREGRIMKVRNGRFQVSEETRFHPERRAG